MLSKKPKIDPVLPDQGGRLMGVDPLGTNTSREEQIRRRAYQLYEQRGRNGGHAEEDWFEAESEIGR